MEPGDGADRAELDVVLAAYVPMAAQANFWTREMIPVPAARVVVMLMIHICRMGWAQAVPAYSVSTWTPAHATFYGGDDASGTMGT